jgi:hypothetical protein
VTAQTRAHLARDLIELDQPAAAVALLEESLAALSASDGIPKARVRFQLARALQHQGQSTARALELAEQARERVRADGDHPRALAAEIEAWLAHSGAMARKT